MRPRSRRPQETYNNNIHALRQSRLTAVLGRRKTASFTHPNNDMPLWQRVLLHPIVLLVWAMVWLTLSGLLVRSGLSAQNALEHKVKAQERLKKEEQKTQKLLETLEEVNSPLHDERVIREELNLQKPGEVILELPSPH